MECYYTGWGVSKRNVGYNIGDGVLVFGKRFQYTGWGLSKRDGVLVYGKRC